MGIEILQNHDRSIEEHRKLVEESARDLLVKNDLRAILALSGSSDRESEEKVVNTITEIITNVKDLRLAILTGGTGGGVPEIGMRIAREASLPTIGVFPLRKYALLDKLDLAIEAFPPSSGKPIWGSESSTFVNLSDGIVIIGGSLGTMTEVSIALKANKGRIEKGERPIYICPIAGSGGVADLVPQFPDIGKVSACLPESPVTTGKDAANYFRTKICS